MFQDLKEYQDLTRIYNESVNISEEQKEINKLFLEADFTAEEIQYLDENFDELWESEFAILTEESIIESIKQENLTEEQLDEILGLRTGVKLAGKLAKKAAPMLKKGVEFAKKGIKSVKTGVKDTLSGAKTVAKRALDKARPILKKVGGVLKKVPGIALPAAAIGGTIAAVNKLRNIGKEKRIKKQVDDYVEKSKNPEGINKVEVKPETKTETRPTNPSGKVIPKPTKPLSDKSPAAKAGIPIEKRQKFADKNAAFQATKKKDSGYTKMDFIKDFPNSQTAKKFNKGERIPGFSYKKNIKSSYEYDAYDLVLEYLLSSEQAATIEEANYVMTEMDAETIQGIVEEQKKNLDEKFNLGKVRIIPALVKGGAAVVGAKMIASKLGQQSGQNQITPPVMPSTTKKEDEIVPGSGIEARKPGESLTDYKKRRTNNLNTQIEKL